MLLAGGAICTVCWVIINRNLNLIAPKELPSFDVLRTVPVGISLIARESITMLNPLANSFYVFRTDAAGSEIGPFAIRNLQPITASVLEYLFVAGGLAGLFVKARKWNHWLGLISLITLYFGGIVVGIGLWKTYGTDPSVSGRYGLAVAPLLAIALVVSLRGRWVLSTLWAFSVALFGITFVYMLAA